VPSMAQRINKNYPITYWDFPFSESADSVDCIVDKYSMVYISGFDTDGKGTFYFAGGYPLRVSCFKGQKLQWRREVSKSRTNKGQLRLRGDSLYLLQDATRELIIMNKDGKGDVRHVSLPVNKVYEGVLHDNHIVISGGPKLVEKRVNMYEVSYFNYQGTLLWRDSVSFSMIHSTMRPVVRFWDTDYEYAPYGKLAKWIQPGDYKGMYYGSELFVVGGSLFVLNCAGQDGNPRTYKIEMPKNAETMFENIPEDVFTDMESRILSKELPILRGTHVYAVGYEDEKYNRIIVSEFDLDKMFPDHKTKIYDRWRQKIFLQRNK